MKFVLEESVTRKDALQLLRENWKFTAETEFVPLAQAGSRVTAQDIYSGNTLPVYRSSCFDGFAVRSAAFENGLPDPAGWVKGTDYVPADTGDDFPDEYDTIIAVEDVYYDEAGHLHFVDGFSFTKGDAVNPAGSLVKAGDLLVPAHTRLTPPLLAALAMGGIHQVPVVRRPRVVYIPTGSELVPAGIQPERGQNIEANGLMLSSFLAQWGADPICFPIVKDDKIRLEAALDEALKTADLVLINGGSSRGGEDFNATLLQEKASFFRHGVRAVPGRPVAISIVAGKPVINVPGPVLAAFLAADWCVSGLVHHYLGLPTPKRPSVTANLAVPLNKNPDFEMLLRVNLAKTAEGFSVVPFPHGSGVPAALRCDGLLTLPIGSTGCAVGDEVAVELLRELECLEQ